MNAPAEPLVTALVSTYASARYMRGCLEDLLEQTLVDRLEILVIDACSPENEGDIVREYQHRHPNIRYVRTPEREGTSAAFNRGAQLARGKYLSTANTDDRHRPDFFARMVEALETNPHCGIAYADSLITTRDNDTFAETTADLRYAWPDFTLTTALSCCLFGAQPVWRKDVHDTVGLWDPAHRCANDQDMFTRIAWRHGAVHVREPLGLFLKRPDSVSGADHGRETLDEVLTVIRRYRTSIPLEDLFPLEQYPGDPVARAAALFELGNLCVLSPYTDAALALQCYQEALELAGPSFPEIRAAFANNTAAILTCAGAHSEAQRAWTLASASPEAQANRLARLHPTPQLRAFRFASPPHPVVTASRTARALVIDSDSNSLQWTAPKPQLPWDVFDGPNGQRVAPGQKLWSFPTAPHSAEPQAPQEPTRADTPVPHVMIVMYGWADSGGGTILPRHIALEMARQGQHVSVVYAAAKPQDDLPPYGIHRHEEDGVSLFGICNRPSAFMDLQHPLREIDDPEVRAAFGAIVDECAPDVVHFFNLHNLGMSLAEVAKTRGLPTVLTSNNYWAICPRLYLIDERMKPCSGGSIDGAKCAACVGTTVSDQAQRQEASLQMLNTHIDRHLAVSHRVRDLYVQNGQDPTRIEVLRQEPPVVTELWERTGQSRAIVERLSRPLRIGYIGSVMPHKGVHVLVEALQALPTGTTEAVVLGDSQPDYLPYLRQLDRRHAVHFAGPYQPDQLHRYLALLDVVVVPSLWDDCAPFVVAEALAARAPVIGSKMGGIPDFIDHGKTGLLFTPGNSRELAGCIAQFADDPTLLGRMQRAIDAPRGLRAHVADLRQVHGELNPPRGASDDPGKPRRGRVACADPRGRPRMPQPPAPVSLRGSR